MYRGIDFISKPELTVVPARSHLVNQSRSHLAYSNHLLSPLYQSLLDDEGQTSDCALKIAVIGQRNIGKTSLIYRIFNNAALHSNYIPTTGVHTLCLHRGFSDVALLPGSASHPLQLQLSLKDFGFRNKPTSETLTVLSRDFKYFDDVQAVLLCYAIDNRESFTLLTQWMRQIYQYTDGKRVAFVLVGLRSDTDKPYLTDAQKKLQRYQGWRVISTLEAYQFSLWHRIPYLECTASLGWFCDDVLATAVHHILRLHCIPSNPLKLSKTFLPAHIVSQMKDENYFPTTDDKPLENSTLSTTINTTVSNDEIDHNITSITTDPSSHQPLSHIFPIDFSY